MLMATEDVEKFRGPWLNPVWVNQKSVGRFNFELYDWLLNDEQAGFFYSSKKGEGLWLYLFTDSNVAFQFKLRYGGR
ncbi:MAG: hypothetical protein EOO77_36655 [Oxalobacteraceae bacterium]|nr:MAG: hypothetical protein EOO77_36655 [Oxalobacteraceae bacterium]